LLLIAVFCGCCRWGPTAWHRGHVYWAQRQCMNYAAPAGKVIFASDANPDKAARTNARAVRAPVPDCWAAFEANLPPPLSVSGADMLYRNKLLARAPVFLHRRQAGSGKERLVVVQLGNAGQGGGGKWQGGVLCCLVIDLATLLDGPRFLWVGGYTPLSPLDWRSTATVYAGHADEKDASHFTIDVDVNWESKTVDGWLQADDTVKLEMRDD
jgi:hypothetical protein